MHPASADRPQGRSDKDSLNDKKIAASRNGEMSGLDRRRVHDQRVNKLPESTIVAGRVNAHAMVICHVLALRLSLAAKRGRTANDLSQRCQAPGAVSQDLMPIRYAR
jgi:hypothetical protein